MNITKKLNIRTDIFKQIGKYRGELMGIAILGVLLCHFAISTYYIPGMFFIAGLVYTQGFLFLSGYGLYYSFKNCNYNIQTFYKKRLLRLYIPFVIMSLPFYIPLCYKLGDGFWFVIRSITTLSFWVGDNWFSMWYIAVSLVLYLLYPLIHKLMFSKSGAIKIQGIILVLIGFIGINEVLKLGNPYCVELAQWLGKCVIFPIGILTAYLAEKRISLPIYIQIIWIACMSIMSMLWHGIEDNYYQICMCLAAIPSFCLLFEAFNLVKIRIVLQWLGKYTLEIYILHCLPHFFMCNICNVPCQISRVIAIAFALISCSYIHNGIEHLLKKIK